MSIPLFVTMPHSGEQVPEHLTPWLKSLPEVTLMRDVDRYVDFLYQPILEKLNIPYVKTEWHRYAVDLNRIPDDVDASSVSGVSTAAGTHARGYHWVMTTYKEPLMKQPMSLETHRKLTQLIYEPFHESVRNLYKKFHDQGLKQVFHIDLHSMPSLGTSEHRDPGELRADIVISDSKGKSCHPAFKDLVIAAYATAGFKVGYNWPYYGGRLTEQYGEPMRGQHTIQVELNRKLYMNEETKKKNESLLPETQAKLHKAIEYIQARLAFIKDLADH